MPESIRLSKAVAEQHKCSRREAELLIEGGYVTVGGTVVEEPEHRVSLDPALSPILVSGGAKALAIAPATVLYHKPSGQIAWDEQLADATWLHSKGRSPNDRSGVSLLRKHLKGMVCVAPLEQAASGLVVFTQDARFQRKLVADRAQLENEVMVEVKAMLSAEHIATIGQSPRNSPLFKVSMTSQSDHSTGLRFALKGNEPGRLADICQAQRLPILAMKRQRVGRVGLTGLAEGQWRFLLPYERF